MHNLRGTTPNHRTIPADTDRSVGPRLTRRRRLHRAARLALPLVLLALAALLVPAADAQASTGGPPAIPTSTAYLGAFAAPHESLNVAQSDIRQELGGIGAFDGVIGRPLGLVHVYQSWQNPVRNSVLSALAVTGATPLIDWTCTSDASITDGSQDAFISSYASALASYGRPVFLRWFWEMNLVNLPRTGTCQAGLGSAGYVQAFRHIHDLFVAAGATNVAFVWCPSINDATFAAAYYPGDQYVDWIAWDGYDRRQDPTMLTTQFLPFYSNWVTHGKPLMIGETGATIDQATYLQNLATNIPLTFPQVKAVVYYDSVSTSDWSLVNVAGNRGLSAFIAMGQLPYFAFPFHGS